MNDWPAAPLVAIVDDDPTCTMMLDRILAREGYHLAIYPSGEAILDAVRTTRFGAICLDLTLPGISGLDTLRRLRADVPSVPVILFTADAEAVIADATGLGAYAVVPKTGAWSELRGAVRGALEFRA